MKRIIVVFLSIIYTFTLSAYAAEDITVYLNGERLAFDQPPIIRNDSTLVPFRAIFEKLNMTVEWNGEERRVTAKKVGTNITLFIDKDEMTVNNEKISLAAPPIIYNDRTLVPLRAVSEAAGAEVKWDGGTRTVYITAEENDENELEKWAREVLELTNAERAKMGIDPLEWDDTLANLAAAHCSDMINRSFFDHINPDGEDSFDRIKKAGIEYWLAGENIAAGQKSPEKVVEAWLNSKGHRQNMINPAYKSLGVSVMKGGEHGIYWVQEFALLK